jgi:hypothetical protein
MIAKLDDTLPCFTDVQWNSVWATHGCPSRLHYKKHVDIWQFSCGVLGKRHKHAQFITITIFLSWIRIIGYEAHTFMMFSHIRHKPAHYIVTFFHIQHRWINHLWHSINFVMDEEPIVQSAWTYLLYFAYVAWIYHVGPTCQIYTKKLFWLPKYNIMSSWWPTWHIGIRLANMSAQLRMNFFRRNSKCQLTMG